MKKKFNVNVEKYIPRRNLYGVIDSLLVKPRKRLSVRFVKKSSPDLTIYEDILWFTTPQADSLTFSLSDSSFRCCIRYLFLCLIFRFFFHQIIRRATERMREIIKFNILLLLSSSK